MTLDGHGTSFVEFRITVCHYNFIRLLASLLSDGKAADIHLFLLDCSEAMQILQGPVCKMNVYYVI